MSCWAPTLSQEEVTYVALEITLCEFYSTQTVTVPYCYVSYTNQNAEQSGFRLTGMTELELNYNYKTSTAEDYVSQRKQKFLGSLESG